RALPVCTATVRRPLSLMGIWNSSTSPAVSMVPAIESCAPSGTTAAMLAPAQSNVRSSRRSASRRRAARRGGLRPARRACENRDNEGGDIVWILGTSLSKALFGRPSILFGQLGEAVVSANRVEGRIGLDVLSPENSALVGRKSAQRLEDQVHRALFIGEAAVPIAAVGLPGVVRHLPGSLGIDAGDVIQMPPGLLAKPQ